jgi:hypothetical protein
LEGYEMEMEPGIALGSWELKGVEAWRDVAKLV